MGANNLLLDVFQLPVAENVCQPGLFLLALAIQQFQLLYSQSKPREVQSKKSLSTVLYCNITEFFKIFKSLSITHGEVQILKNLNLLPFNMMINITEFLRFSNPCQLLCICIESRCKLLRYKFFKTFVQRRPEHKSYRTGGDSNTPKIKKTKREYKSSISW